MIGKISRLFIICFVLCSTTWAAPFGPNGDGPRIAIGEVHCYGQYDLNHYADILQDRIDSNMRESRDFNVVSGTPNPELMSQIHMNAIVLGHYYNRGTSGPQLINYGKKVLGKNYRPTDAEVAEKVKAGGTAYMLSPEVAEAARRYAEAEGIDYMLFANLNHVEVWLRNSIFNVRVADEYRGKSVTTNVEYYLVNPHTGMVYDGFNSEKVTAQMINALIVEYGKAMDVAMMFSIISDRHVKRITQKLSDSGFKKLSSR